MSARMFRAASHTALQDTCDLITFIASPIEGLPLTPLRSILLDSLASERECSNLLNAVASGARPQGAEDQSAENRVNRVQQSPKAHQRNIVRRPDGLVQYSI